MEDPTALEAVFNDQVDRFYRAEDRAEAEEFAESMVNIYHRDKPMYDAWRLVAEIVKAPTDLKPEDLKAIEKTLTARVALKAYLLYLKCLEDSAAHLSATFLLSNAEVTGFAGRAKVTQHELHGLLALNQEVNKKAGSA